MEVREARSDEIPLLKEKLAASDMERIDLDAARVWVALEEGAIVGFVSLRMVWQMEPLYIFPECRKRMARRRAIYGLYREASAWMGDRKRNLSGIHWMFAITRNLEVRRWMVAMGWHRQYKSAATYIKHF